MSARMKIHRSPNRFLLGASWSYHASWPERRTHIYLGPFLLTITSAGVSL